MLSKNESNNEKAKKRHFCSKSNPSLGRMQDQISDTFSPISDPAFFPLCCHQPRSATTVMSLMSSRIRTIYILFIRTYPLISNRIFIFTCYFLDLLIRHRGVSEGFGTEELVLNLY